MTSFELATNLWEAVTDKFPNLFVECDEDEAILLMSNYLAGLIPAAYRVKDFADGWILVDTYADAKKEAKSAGNLIESLIAIKQEAE